jgi:integrase
MSRIDRQKTSNEPDRFSYPSLSEQAVRALRSLREMTGSARYVVPHRDKPGRPIDPARFRYVMRQVGLGKGASPHALRTTFSTWANERAFRPDAIERQLAHAEKDRIRATYNKAQLMDERRAMMQAWADHLDAVSAGGDVVPLRAKAA